MSGLPLGKFADVAQFAEIGGLAILNAANEIQANPLHSVVLREAINAIRKRTRGLVH